MLAPILREIVDNTPGAVAAVLMGFDGIAVEQYSAPAGEFDIEAMAVEFSFRFMELRNAAQSLDMGEVSDITLKAERGTVLVRCLSPEYFVAVLLESPGHFGKGRWLLRAHAARLRAEL